MSEHITHVAVFEDTARILRADKNRFPAIFSECLDEAYDTGLATAASRGGNRFILPILIEDKRHRSRFSIQQRQERFAAAIGFMAHGAADRVLKEMHKAAADADHPLFAVQEAQIYHDAVVFNQVYQGGRLGTESPDHDINRATLSVGMTPLAAASAVDAAAVERLMSYALMDKLIAVRGSNYDQLDAQAFAEALIDDSQDLYEPLDAYAMAAHSPDYNKLIRYIYKPNFYNANDAIIKIVRAIQTQNQYPKIRELSRALRQAEQQSGYARTLKLAYGFFTVAAAFYRGEISMSEAYQGFRLSPKHIEYIESMVAE